MFVGFVYLGFCNLAAFSDSNNVQGPMLSVELLDGSTGAVHEKVERDQDSVSVSSKH